MTNEAKQGCVMTTTLLCMMLSAMLIDAVQVCDVGFPIRYRFDGKLFNQRKLKAKTKVHIDVLNEILYTMQMT